MSSVQQTLKHKVGLLIWQPRLAMYRACKVMAFPAIPFTVINRP